VRRDLPGGQPASRQRQHDLLDAIQAALTLAHNGWREGCVPVAGYCDVSWPDLGHHCLGAGAMARVTPVATHGFVLVIAQVLGHLRLQCGLEHRPHQSGQQTTLANQLHPLGTGLLHQFLRKSLLINLSRHRLDHLGHYWSFPPSVSLSVSGQLHP
jgi:hypothetical protein